MEEVWTVVHICGTQSILKIGLNRPLMREFLDKFDECEGKLSELLIDSATDESEANSPIKMTPQEDKGKVVYLSRTRKGTMRSKSVIDKIKEMKMKLDIEEGGIDKDGFRNLDESFQLSEKKTRRGSHGLGTG